MATYSKQLLSGSTNGMGIKVAATATPGTLVHTAIAGTSAIDLIYLWVNNTDSAAHTITIEFGDATSPDHHLVDAFSIAANSGQVQVCFGIPLQNGKTVKIFASAANVIIVHGYVNRVQ